MKKKTIIISALVASASLMLLSGCSKKPKAKPTETEPKTTEVAPQTSTETTVVEWNAPTYSWSEDFTKCTATRVSKDSAKTETETVDVVYSVTQEVECLVSGLGVYTATFENSAFETQTHEEEIGAVGHVYDDENDSICNKCGAEREQVNNYFISSVGNMVYNGQKQELVEGEDFTISFGTAKVYYKIKDAEDSTYTEEAPKYAGDYTAKIVVEETAAYKGINETVDFSIAKKKLSNIVIEREYGPGVSATMTGGYSSGWGICSGDTVKIQVKTNADYSTVAYVGDNKTVISAEIIGDSPSNGSYELPALNEIVFNIKKAKINLSNGPVNWSSYNNIWAGTGSAIPRLNFNLGLVGEKAHDWEATDTIEKWDGANWVSIGDNYSTQSSYASANAGKYRISTKITCYDNFEIVGSDTYLLEFEVKEIITLTSVTDKITIEAGEEKAFVIPLTSYHLFEVGNQLGDAEIEIFTKDGWGIYQNKLDYFFDKTIRCYYSNVLVKIKANSKIFNKVIFEDVSYSDRIELTDNETNVTTTNGAGKWVEYYVSFDTYGDGQFDFLFDGLGDYVFFTDEGDYTFYQVEDDAISGEINYQGGEISIIIYLENDITNGSIYFE